MDSFIIPNLLLVHQYFVKKKDRSFLLCRLLTHKQNHNLEQVHLASKLDYMGALEWSQTHYKYWPLRCLYLVQIHWAMNKIPYFVFNMDISRQLYLSNPWICQWFFNIWPKIFLRLVTIVYWDDILIFSKTQGKHDEQVHQVLQLREYGLHAKLVISTTTKWNSFVYILSLERISIESSKGALSFLSHRNHDFSDGKYFFDPQKSLQNTHWHKKINIKYREMSVHPLQYE